MRLIVNCCNDTTRARKPRRKRRRRQLKTFFHQRSFSMSLDIHTYTSNNGAKLTLAKRTAISNSAGAAGATVSVAVTVTDKYGNAALPSNLAYIPVVAPSQDCRWYITAKTASGFTVNLVPKDASTALVAGTIDVAILG
jgi:hypothetical protein